MIQPPQFPRFTTTAEVPTDCTPNLLATLPRWKQMDSHTVTTPEDQTSLNMVTPHCSDTAHSVGGEIQQASSICGSVMIVSIATDYNYSINTF